MAIADTQQTEKTKQQIKEPSKWKVVFLNDDTTPIDFVISLLMEIFKHPADVAKKITLEIHNSGSGVAGVYSFEIAEAKAVEATQLSRSNGFRLQITLEEDS